MHLKRVKFIALSLVITFTLMGAGYAVWSEKITISNTVQTGNMVIKFVQEQTPGNNNQLYNIYPNIAGNDTNNDKSDDLFRVSYRHGERVTYFTMENLYPGVTVWYEAKIKNVGNIPAYLSNIQVVYGSNASEALKQNIKVRGQMQHWKANTGGSATKVASYDLPLEGTTQYGIKKNILNGNNTNGDGTGSGDGNGHANGSNVVTLGELEQYINALIKSNKRTLEPGDFFTFDIDDEYKTALLQEDDLKQLYVAEEAPNCLWFTLPREADNSTMGQSANFSIHFNFNQFNK